MIRVVLRKIVLLVAGPFLIVAAHAQPDNAPYELQERCARQAAQTFQKEWGGNAVSTNKAHVVANYESHYSPRFGKCLDEVVLSTNPYSSHGHVEEIHQEQRDSAFLNFACFRTNARFDPAMSGGPVLTDEGILCGIICANLPPEGGAESAGHTSYVSTLWPCMTTLVGFPIQNQPAENYLAIELVSRGYLDAIDRERVEIIIKPNSDQLRITLRNPPR